MKKVILLAALAFSTIGFSQTMGGNSQEPTSIYGSVKNRKHKATKVDRYEIIKVTHPTSEIAINKYGKQLRTGYTLQGVGLATTAIGVSILAVSDGEGNADGAYVVCAAGLLSAFIGQVVVWDSSKHLRVSTNGLNLKVKIK